MRCDIVALEGHVFLKFADYSVRKPCAKERMVGVYWLLKLVQTIDAGSLSGVAHAKKLPKYFMKGKISKQQENLSI